MLTLSAVLKKQVSENASVRVSSEVQVVSSKHGPHYLTCFITNTDGTSTAEMASTH